MIKGFIEFFKNIKRFGLEFYKLYYGSYRATVYDNEDPKELGRLQVQIEGIYEEPYEYWASSKNIYSGNGKGFYFIPAIGDEVWVTFEYGNPKFPVWSYGFWKEKPTEGSLTNKVLKTDSGNLLEFDDVEELIRYTSAKGKVIEISDTISLGTKDKSKEAAILGDTLKTKLDTYADIVDSTLTGITKLTVPTAFGASGVPINSATFVQIQQDLATLKSSLAAILSKIVTLD